MRGKVWKRRGTKVGLCGGKVTSGVQDMSNLLRLHGQSRLIHDSGAARVEITKMHLPYQIVEAWPKDGHLQYQPPPFLEASRPSNLALQLWSFRLPF